MRIKPATGLESVYREHGAKIWRTIAAYSGDPEVASDATAEAFAQALRRGSEIRSPLAWVWAAAFRIAAAELKRRGRQTELVETSYELDGAPAELRDALGALSPKQRSSVLLFHYGGHSVKETAKILDSSPSAIRVHLSQGRKRLRALLEETND